MRCSGKKYVFIFSKDGIYKGMAVEKNVDNITTLIINKDGNIEVHINKSPVMPQDQAEMIAKRTILKLIKERDSIHKDEEDVEMDIADSPETIAFKSVLKLKEKLKNNK